MQTLNEMMEHLRLMNEIAVDLEHHQLHSYFGFTCLIQISSRERDFIVDPLAQCFANKDNQNLNSNNQYRNNHINSPLNILNEVFTDQSITKVLHGAEMDILWLQRDFGVYIVNMFDTHQASVMLNFQKRSLDELIRRIVLDNKDTRICYESKEANQNQQQNNKNSKSNRKKSRNSQQSSQQQSYTLQECVNEYILSQKKRFQMSDWRLRPLPQQMIDYARQDTHCLLFIYDQLRIMLSNKEKQD
ncbi:MAG: putative exosome component RRP6 [Streblomastix strix]|uniref:Putative exosome component RRP6 n=1 Tax=Streblomastix strix TaxID=222440 RepID=A0A5J4VI85_9EUKA|nr:MAG: putative exosome component RRP6 [Streblomastix strix]